MFSQAKDDSLRSNYRGKNPCFKKYFEVLNELKTIEYYWFSEIFLERTSPETTPWEGEGAYRPQGPTKRVQGDRHKTSLFDMNVDYERHLVTIQTKAV